MKKENKKCERKDIEILFSVLLYRKKKKKDKKRSNKPAERMKSNLANYT